MIACADSLNRAGYRDLATRYEKYIKLLRDTALIIFYESDGKIRTVTLINDTAASVTRANYKSSPCSGDPCFLDDPYEVNSICYVLTINQGELMAFFMDLYGDWSSMWSADEREKIWTYKR
jgi:hypothetical protein